MSVPTVVITKVLKDALSEDGYDVADYLVQFRDWKTDWNRREYTFWFFGKDGENKFPLRDKKKVLSHVHLPPEIEAKSRDFWDKKFDDKGKKTSNTVLFYAGSAKLNRDLLLFVVTEPNGHDVQEMNTPDDNRLMNMLADQAAAYIDTGEIYL
ncbi:type II toxin-antitoxin system YafO family toxin [Acidovorax sp. Leaf160]|uniref:type II toxin-antitoxin system YafO family toxin n=1 Tax=Acidovorax sp. Leaf160 TaxID=1736280 RepID=UPI0012E372D2|nr:type II toxin-antitoxin system YafO family toxin [Acidovorax sp. Leaf160]